MKIAYFDCFAGAGGDMIVAAMLDAGLDAAMLKSQLATLGLEFELAISSVTRCGIKATHFDPRTPHQHHHRHLPDILAIIEKSGISAVAKQNATRVFHKLAAAEGHIHNIDAHEVHFHEVGAVDSIVDIVAACVGFDAFKFDAIHSSPLAVGGGTVKTEHGILPVPAPATAELLKNIPTVGGPLSFELLTPTAAAVLTSFVTSFGLMPAMNITATGYGAGSRDSDRLPNVLRLVIGQDSSGSGLETDTVCLLETNCDDITGELAGHIVETLLAAGALDAFVTPIYMKHTRPAVKISVLCEQPDAARFEHTLFEQGITLGIRRQILNRSKLPRQFKIVETRYGPVTVKVGLLGGKPAHVKPEFAECAALAAQHNVPVKTIIAAALDAFAPTT